MLIDLKRHSKIKRNLHSVGTSLADVARELAVAPATVSTVSQGYRRSERIQQAIAKRLGVTAAELWPDRYEERKEALKKQKAQ